MVGCWRLTKEREKNEEVNKGKHEVCAADFWKSALFWEVYTVVGYIAFVFYSETWTFLRSGQCLEGTVFMEVSVVCVMVK